MIAKKNETDSWLCTIVPIFWQTLMSLISKLSCPADSSTAHKEIAKKEK
jgi:hypothetical protein